MGHFVQFVIFVIMVASRAASVKPSKILMSGLFGEGSHFTALVPIGRSLVHQGHNVTFLISEEFSYRARDPELSQLFDFEIFSYNNPSFSAKEGFRAFAEIGIGGSNGFLQTLKFYNVAKWMFVDTCESVLEDEALMSRLASIDAIVFELPWPCGVFIKSYIERHRNATDVRLVLSSATAPVTTMFWMAGSPINPSYQPASWTSYSSSMTFPQRIINSMFSATMIGISEFMVRNGLQKAVAKFDLQPNLASLEVSKRNIDLFLTNCDFATEFPFPLMPNVIAIGGTTARPAMPLERELEAFMQSSGEHGVVLFAMGSYFSLFTTSRPDEMKLILDALGRLPQKVVMQIRDPSLYNIPENVKAMSWIPQNDLLGHRKTRAFLFHAGNNGYFEALYHGVPMVVIPIYGDHIDVAARIISRDIGVMINKDNITTDYLHSQLKDVITSPKYTANVKRLSAIFRDRPMNPSDRAAFWIQHVIKHGGDYMRSPAHDLSFIQYHLIDIALFMLIVLCLSLFLTICLVRKCLNLICRNVPKHKSD